MGTAVVVLGLPGSGKSTVSKAVAAQMKDVVTTDFADHMIDDEAERDLLQHLPLDERRKLFAKAQSRISDLVASHNGIALVEAHFVLRIDGRIVNLGLSLLDAIKPTALVLIDAPAETIAERRRNDQARNRIVESPDELQILQARSYQRALEIAFSRSLRFSVLLNEVLESSVLEMCRFVERMKLDASAS